MDFLLRIQSRGESVLFRNSRDYGCFLRILLNAKNKFQVSIFAFCLMPEYVKLIVHIDSMNVSKDFISCLIKDYAVQSILKKREINDVLPFKAWRSCFKNDWQLFSEIKKIEFEPVQAGFVVSPAHYRYSSAFYRIQKNLTALNEHFSSNDLMCCHRLN